jgi:hypothetical protein
MRRFPLAFLLVGVMCLLAAGGAVLGAFEAPTGTALEVHNGAGETLQASRVIGTYTTSQLSGTVISFNFVAPDHVTEEAISPKGKVEGRRDLTGPAASNLLGPVRQLLGIHKFSANGSYYAADQSASVLVPAYERSAVTGTYDTRVEIQGGYVVAIYLDINVDLTSHGARQHVAETVRYRLSRVDGWTRAK